MTKTAKHEWPPIWHVAIVLGCSVYAAINLRDAFTALRGGDWGLAASLAFFGLVLAFVVASWFRAVREIWARQTSDDSET